MDNFASSHTFAWQRKQSKEFFQPSRRNWLHQQNGCSYFHTNQGYRIPTWSVAPGLIVRWEYTKVAASNKLLIVQG